MLIVLSPFSKIVSSPYETALEYHNQGIKRIANQYPPVMIVAEHQCADYQ